MKRLFVLLLLALGCTQGNGNSNGNTAENFPTGNNVVPVMFSPVNRPTVTVTVCVPGTSQCQAVPNVLLDSGSDGLRLFSQAVPLNLPAVADSSADVLGLCATFGGTQSAWGSYRTADVSLGADRASSVPIQIMDSTFASVPAACAGVMSGPAAFGGLNGILGIGMGADVPGSSVPPGNGFYSCQGASCTLCPVTSSIRKSSKGWSSCGTAFPSFPKDLNPVSFLSADGNGWILDTAPVPAGGTNSLAAALVLGLGTENNNAIPPGAEVFPINADGFIPVAFQGQTYNAVLDTGTVSWLFPAELQGVPTCGTTGAAATLYCPSVTMNLQATFSEGAASSTVQFQIANLNGIQGGIANDIGQVPCAESFCQGVFLVGAPFFMGRDVYYGINGATTPRGTGPFNAF